MHDGGGGGHVGGGHMGGHVGGHTGTPAGQHHHGSHGSPSTIPVGSDHIPGMTRSVRNNPAVAGSRLVPALALIAFLVILAVALFVLH
jgi:hypothetical protein